MISLKKLTFAIVLSIVPIAFALGQSIETTKTKTVTSKDGLEIVYDILGNGSTALVFVHGWSCDRSYWQNQVEYFSQQYKVITVDLGGHGTSGMSRQEWTIISFGNDVASVVAKEELDEVILIGHSMGGDVIVDAALQILPKRTIGLIMVDTYKKIGAGRSIEQIELIVDDFRINFSEKVKNLVRNMYLPGSNPELVNNIALDMSSAPMNVAINAMKWSFTHSRQIAHDLELLDLPVFAINADYEPTDVESLKRHEIETIVMPNVGHFLMMEDPERFNEILDNTIKKVLSDRD